MSGFVGLFNFDGAPVDVRLLHQMTLHQLFRGPHGQQVWSQGHIGLGHTLLHTTFESEHEQQPLSLDGQVWIVGDVRLDGHAELIRLLLGSGRCVDKDAPDIEVLLHAYHLWGEACLERLSGDFAFALWDGTGQRLFCARDQLGITPFYYAQINQTLIVSNTLGCLLLHPQVSAKLNDQAIADHLIFNMNLDWAATSFVDIQRLPPAHQLSWSDRTLRIRKYWSLPERTDFLHYRRANDYVEEFLHLFDQAVSDRLRTNRLATYLSGGMDSTSVAATAHKLLSQTGRPFTFQAYSIDYEVKADPELAQKAAQFMGNETELISAKEYMLRAPDEEPSYLTPEPTYILNLLSEVELLRRASAKSHIIFTGHGGDPSFMHSPYYWRDLLKRGEIGLLVKNMYWHIQLHHQMPPLYLSQTLPIPQTLRNLRRRIRAHTNPSEVQQTFTFPAFLKTDLIRSFNLQDRYQEFWLKASIGGYQQGMATSPFWSNMFAWSDPGFNGIPLKHRYPFFDLRLLRFILAVPRIPWCINKALLRTAMKGRLPEAVLHQPKMYAASLSELMPYRKAPSWMRSLAHESALEPYIENPRLIKMVQELRQITGEGYRQISRVFSLAYWLRHWRPPKPADVPETFLYHTATSKYQ